MKNYNRKLENLNIGDILKRKVKDLDGIEHILYQKVLYVLTRNNELTIYLLSFSTGEIDSDDLKCGNIFYTAFDLNLRNFEIYEENKNI